MIDFSEAPTGELAATKLVTEIADQKDLADLYERHFLELKGPSSLDSKADKHKIAKFILGAANRSPERAKEAFEGYAVMLIGITENGATGIPPIEMLELQKVIKPFLGENGPRWDLVRVPAEDPARQVLVILVYPPKDGQPAFVCRENGDRLMSGHIYFRDDGETRQATADEMDMLLSRGVRVETAAVDIQPEIIGSVTPLVIDEEATLEEYIRKTRTRLMRAMPEPEPPAPKDFPSGTKGAYSQIAASRGLTSSAQYRSPFATSFEEPEPRTRDEYITEIDTWEKNFRSAWPRAVEELAKSVLPANEVRVINNVDTFLYDVKIQLHLEGDVESLDSHYYDGSIPDWNELRLPRYPRAWGPLKKDFLPPIHQGILHSMPDLSGIQNMLGSGSSSSWKNTGSVTVEVEVGDLRPRDAFSSDDGEAALVIRNQTEGQVQGTWRATAKGHDKVFEGELRVEIVENPLLTQKMREFLKLG